MPFNGKTFASRHNKSMVGNAPVASKAAKMANAMMRSGADEGVAIATASKRASGAVAKDARAASHTIKAHNQRKLYA